MSFKDPAVNELQSQVSFKDPVVNEMQSQVSFKDPDVNELQSQVSFKDPAVNELQSQVSFRLFRVMITIRSESSACVIDPSRCTHDSCKFLFASGTCTTYFGVLSQMRNVLTSQAQSFRAPVNTPTCKRKPANERWSRDPRSRCLPQRPGTPDSTNYSLESPSQDDP